MIDGNVDGNRFFFHWYRKIASTTFFVKFTVKKEHSHNIWPIIIWQVNVKMFLFLHCSRLHNVNEFTVDGDRIDMMRK